MSHHAELSGFTMRIELSSHFNGIIKIYKKNRNLMSFVRRQLYQDQESRSYSTGLEWMVQQRPGKELKSMEIRATAH